jgi:hypothetical protein
VFVIRKLVNVSVANMSRGERAIGVNRDIGTWTRSGAARNANVISMEVSMKIATFTRASVFASSASKVPNVIDAKVDFMDSRQMDAKVRDFY